MKNKDILFIAICLGFLSLFVFIKPLGDLFLKLSSYKDWRGLIMAFVKFGILATLGESIGLRIKTGVYNFPGFGLAPRAIMWGFLGLIISMAMTIFAVGTPAFVGNLGVNVTSNSFEIRLLVAFCTSVAMNIFAPVFMTFHKITDTHIMNNGGTLSGLFKPIKIREILTGINWTVLWGFVFKKTLPLFWVPAHTITFMLPAQWRVLFAAVLSIVLGIILSVASRKQS